MRGGKVKKILANIDFEAFPKMLVFHTSIVSYLLLAFRQNANQGFAPRNNDLGCKTGLQEDSGGFARLRLIF